MSRAIGLRLKDNVMDDITGLARELGINQSKVIRLLIDVALGTHDVNMIKNHYYNVGEMLFKHGNTKKQGR